MSVENTVNCVHSFEKHVKNFLIVSSEVSIVVTTHTSHPEVAYLQKLVLHCSAFLYHDLSCELWKIYCAAFHALGWLSKCWFTSSICRQFFLPIKDPKSCHYLSWLWWSVYSSPRSLGWMCTLCILWCHCSFLVFWKGAEDAGYRMARFPWRDNGSKEWVHSQPSPPARTIKISFSAANLFWFQFQTQSRRKRIIFLKKWQLAHSSYCNTGGNTNVLQIKIILTIFFFPVVH